MSAASTARISSVTRWGITTVGTHLVGGTDLWQSFGQDRSARGFAREIVAADAAPLAVRLLQAEVGSLRGAIGTPTQVTELIARYQAAGVDQLMFVLQSGRNRHEHICESIELFAREVLPRFAEHRAEQEQAKADRLAAAVDRALARRPARRTLPASYQIDEEAEVTAARRARQRPLRELAGQAAGAARTALSSRLQAGPQRLAASVSDAGIERLTSGSTAQRAIFGLLASRFDAARSAGFDGTIAFDLGVSDGTRRCWAIEVSGGRARARAGRYPMRP